MQHRLTTMIVAAATLALAVGTAIGAERSKGAEGSGEAARAAPGGPRLSEKGKPMAPKIEEGEGQRDLQMDPAKVEQGFGTVSRSKGGQEKRAPLSEGMRSILKDAATDAGQDPAFRNGEASRQVFGADDRVQITNTKAYPFRVIGLLQSETKTGDVGNCSATLIGPKTVLTAAHCLYSHDDGGWLDNFVFAPGLIDMQTAPYGVYEYETAHIFEGFVSNYKGYYGSVVPWDIAVVILKQPVGEQLGYLPFGYDDSLGDFYANIVGYPGDKPAGTQWRANCDVPAEALAQMYFQYQCDTFPGSSGSSVYRYEPSDQSRTIYGVNVAENKNANTAVRINELYYTWLEGLVQ